MFYRNGLPSTIHVLLLLSGILIFLHPVSAQQNKTDSTLQGIVVDALNGRSVSNTLVTLLSLDKKTRTNQIGEFKFQNIPEKDLSDKVTFSVDHRAYKKFIKTVNLDKTERIMLQLERKPRLQ